MTEETSGRGDAASRAPDLDPNELTIWEELAQRSWLGPRMRLCIRHAPTGIEVKQRDLRMTSYTARRVLIAELSEKVAEARAQAPASTAQSIATKAKDLADMVCKSLNRAWHLGQTYWQQADSEYASQNRKSEATQAAYQALVDETRSALLFGGYALPSIEHNAPPMPKINPARDAQGFVWQHTGDPTPRPPHYVPPKIIPFQARVQPWMLECFGAEIAADAMERNHRFFEEATELVQACGMTESEAHQLVDYVYGRPRGEKHQEIGGVMVTLAALCLAQGDDMHAAAETELARVWTKVEQIRAKQAAKPKHSPLPEHPAPRPVAYLNETPPCAGVTRPLPPIDVKGGDQ